MTSGEAQVDRYSLHKQPVVTTIVTGSSPRLAHRYLGGFLWLLLELINGHGKGNDGTLSEYKLLPSAVTKCLLQVRVWWFSGRFVHLMTRTQRFSSLLFFKGRAKKDEWRSLLDLLERSGTQQRGNILQQRTLFNVLPLRPKFLFNWSILIHKPYCMPLITSRTDGNNLILVF